MWLQPGGHIDSGEMPWEAALREAREETGLPVIAQGGTAIACCTSTCTRVHVGTPTSTFATTSHHPPWHRLRPPGESPDVRWFSWSEAIATAEPGLEGVLRANQPGQPTIRPSGRRRCCGVRPRLQALEGVRPARGARAAHRGRGRDVDGRRGNSHDGRVGRRPRWCGRRAGHAGTGLVAPPLHRPVVDGPRPRRPVHGPGQPAPTGRAAAVGVPEQRRGPTVLRAPRLHRRRVHRRCRQRGAVARRALRRAEASSGDQRWKERLRFPHAPQCRMLPSMQVWASAPCRAC